MHNKIQGKRYDVVFWSHGHNEVERFLPLMVGLKKRGVRSLLFYQDYNIKDGIRAFQQNIIEKYGLETADYSYFIKSNMLDILTFLSMGSPSIFIANKLRGLRTRIFKRNIKEDFIRRIVMLLGHRLNVFDHIGLAHYIEYPYGSYYIKKISDQLNLKSIAVPHGVTVCKFKEPTRKKKCNFKYNIVCNDYEKELKALICTDENAQIIALGDPRFDTGWKNELKTAGADRAALLTKKDKLNVVYICPNLGGLGHSSENFKSISDIMGILKSVLGDAHLLIKPHPRCRAESTIRNIMRRNRIEDYMILSDEPLIVYADAVDIVISTLSSAVNDILPEYPEKLVIFDNFSKDKGIINIYEKDFNCFSDTKSLCDFLKSFTAKKSRPKDKRDPKIDNFCREWIGAGGPVENIVDNYCNYISNLIKN